jgi:cytochrome c peroxidase
MNQLSSASWTSLLLGTLVACSSARSAPTRIEEPAKTDAARVVVTRVVAAWCGTCQVLARHTGELLPPALASQVQYVDVVVADEDNAPASAAAGDAWRSAYASGAEATLRTDLPMAELFDKGHRPLPWVVVQREGNDAVLAALANPTFAVLRGVLEDALGSEHSASPGLDDGRFDAFDVALLETMRLADRPPPDPSNEVADDARAAAFGRRLFFDRGLSPANVSCGSCHDPALLLTDGKGVPPEGAGRGVRNVPSVALAGRARWQLWDGRSDALWAQALLPFEDAAEFDSSRLFVAHAIASRHDATYRELFGELPALEDAARFPATGKPGDAVWSAMSATDRQAVSDVFVNVGKTLAAFERGIEVKPNALDRYLDGDLNALDELQKDGLLAFLRAGCAQCHHGERLTDDAFHNLRFPTGHGDGGSDPGRSDGIAKLAAQEFRVDEARATALSKPEVMAAAQGAFKTPGLRGVAFTLPYGHGGAYGGLTSVIEAHRSCGLPAESRLTLGECEPWVSGFQAADAPKIEAFLRALRLDLQGATAPE